ncbi:MAG: uracil-DNA glycosylase [Chloroflexi bacterium]|nr:MAG: uracil-DNA glycosylase [Chloroflexota bacterium]
MTIQVRLLDQGRQTQASQVELQLATLPPLDASSRIWHRQRQLEILHAEIAACHLCVDAGYIEQSSGASGCRGRIGDRLMLIGQAPGHLSVERGFPFAGPGGRVLTSWLQRAGYPKETLYSHIYLSALTKCDPGKNSSGTGDRRPSGKEQALCRPFLFRELELLRPSAILLVGSMAIDAFLGPQRLGDVIGRQYLCNGVRLLPLPHPSGVSRWLNSGEHQQQLAAAIDILASWRVAQITRQDQANPPAVIGGQ